MGVPERSCYRRARAVLDLVDVLMPEVAMTDEGGAEQEL